MRVLLAAHASVGHSNALRSIGRALLAGGDAVAMAMPVTRTPPFLPVPELAKTAAAIPSAVRADGMEIFPLSPSLVGLWHALRISRARGIDELEHALGYFLAGAAPQARAIAAAATSFRADLVVADYLLFAAMFGARLARAPYVSIYHSALPFPVEGAPPMGSELGNDEPAGSPARHAAERRLEILSARCDARLSAVARALDVEPPPGGSLTRPSSTVLNVLTTVPELEPGLRPLDAPVLFAGPCIFGRGVESPNDPSLVVLRDDVTRVYVSMGTVFNDDPTVFETLLCALDGPDLQVIVSAGASAERLQRRIPTTNSRVFARVPQVALLERVDLVVTHGGNNTVQETLAAGKPMLVVPFGGDQLANARRVERLGAGVAVLPARLDVDSVRTAFGRLRSDATFRERARACAAALAGVDGTMRAVDALRSLPRHSASARAP